MTCLREPIHTLHLPLWPHLPSFSFSLHLSITLFLFQIDTISLFPYVKMPSTTLHVPYMSSSCHFPSLKMQVVLSPPPPPTSLSLSLSLPLSLSLSLPLSLSLSLSLSVSLSVSLSLSLSSLSSLSLTSPCRGPPDAG